jgi:hypothetical protein
MLTAPMRHQLVLRKLLPLLGWLMGFGALFALYLFASQFVANNSDNASMILEGQAMLHGNLFLRGWYVPPDSFITTEMAIDALGSLFFSGEHLLKITPAFLYAATVLVATYLAARRVTDPDRRWLAGVACLALIAFPIGYLFSIILQGPTHMGTIVVTLLAWVAYDAYVRRPASWGWLGLFVLVTTLVVIGDPVSDLVIVAPVGIVSAWALWRRRGRDRTARAVLGGALVSLLLGFGLEHLLIATGTIIAVTTPGFASPDLIWSHLQWAALGICLLFHIDLHQGIGFNQQLLFLALNAGFLVLGGLGFAGLGRRALLPRDPEESLGLTSVLCWGIVCSLLVYLLSTFATDVGGIRYLLPAIVYAGILCSSAFAAVVARPHLGPVLLAFLAMSILIFGITLAQTPRATAPEQRLIAFLESHHLSSGLGSYWAANITTLRSNGQVQVVPVLVDHGKIRPYHWHASVAWFGAGHVRTARFVVIDGTAPVRSFEAAVIASFGTPDHTYYLPSYPTYVIFAWDHPFTGTGLP